MNPTSRPTVSLTANPPGAALGRLLVCLKEGNGHVGAAAEIAKRHCVSTPAVEATLTKAAIGAMATSTAGNGLELAPYLTAEFFALLQSVSIAARIGALARTAPFHSKAPREIATGAGSSWRGQGLARPVLKTATDLVTIDYFEMSTIFALTAETFRFGSQAEAALAKALVQAVARFLDQQFLTAAVGATASNPAAVTRNAPVVISTGATAANITADLVSMLEAIQSPADTLRWCMRPKTYYAILAKLAGAGCSQPLGTLVGVPVVLGSMSPPQITLIDTDALLFTDDGNIAIEATRHGDLEMSDAPGQSGIAGTGAQMVSLWSAGLVAIKATLGVSWQPASFSAGSPTAADGIVSMAVAY